MAGRGHNGHRWRQARAAVIGTDWDGPLVCHLCKRAIDRNAEPRTRWAPTIDLIRPWSKGGDPLDVSNLRAAHHGCNSTRGNRPVGQYQRHARAPRAPVRRWTSEDAP